MNHSSLEDIAEAIYNGHNYEPYGFQYVRFHELWPSEQKLYIEKAKEYLHRKDD